MVVSINYNPLDEPKQEYQKIMEIELNHHK